MIKLGGIYKNKKNGGLYQADAVGINCTNEQDQQKMVRYHALPLSRNRVEFYREISEFQAKFDAVG